jgi:hypothetical protein
MVQLVSLVPAFLIGVPQAHYGRDVSEGKQSSECKGLFS